MQKQYNIRFFLQDVLVGILIMLISIPISMGYAMVAGLPAIYGLYGSVFPILLFGIFSSSPRFVFGVDAAPAALVGGILASMEIAGGGEAALNMIPVITCITTLWLLLFYIFSANKILKFISQPVMGGFITGIGVTIIMMQVPKLFGGDAGTGELVELLIHALSEAEKGVNLLSLLLGLGTIGIILVMKKLAPKLPMQAIMMGIGALLTYFFHLETYGVRMLPSVEAGLPSFRIPNLLLLEGNVEEIIFPSLTIALVILSETLLSTSNIALKYDDKIKPRREILTYFFCNAAATFTGCCPVNGSVSRTGIADQFGVKSQVMSGVAGLSMMLVLLFGTGFISYLPVPVLTGIVISALIGTFEFHLAKKLKRVDKAEYIIFYAAFLSVLLFGTIYGVIVGIILSTATFIIRQSKPATTLLGVIEGEKGFHSKKRVPDAAVIRRVILYRFTGALFYANIGQFQDEIAEAVKPDTKVIVVDSSRIGSVDVTAAERLLMMWRRYQEKGIQFYLAGHIEEIEEDLVSFDAEELVKHGVVCVNIEEALGKAGITEPYDFEEENSGTEKEEKIKDRRVRKASMKKDR